MLVVGTIWRPADAGVPAQVAAWLPAVADQGPYAAGSPFGAFVVATAATDAADLLGLGDDVWAWRVEEHVPRASPAASAVSMVSLMRRNPSLSHDEFVAHWRTQHAPLALRRHVGLADYRQYVVVETLTAGTPEIDGIARLGFVSRTDFDERFFDSDAGRAEILADVARFMDRPGPETTLVGPPGGPGVAG